MWRRMMMIRIFVFLLIILCSSCLPYPHYEVEVSNVIGNVTKDNKPLNGATVKISQQYDWSCNKAVADISKTDSEGNFELKGKKKFRFIRSVIGDPYYINQICIISGEETFLGYLQSDVGFPSETLQLKCKITSESVPVTDKTPRSGIHRYAVCRPDS
jgi:hypothetical protein